MQKVIVVIGNGFDPQNLTEPDDFTEAALRLATDKYRHWKAKRQEVVFVLLRSIVRSPKGTTWFEAMRDYALSLGVDDGDIYISTAETWNALTDALGILEVARRWPYAELRVVVYAGGWVADYLRQTYDAVAQHIMGEQVLYHLHYPDYPEPDKKSLILYRLLWWVTLLASISTISFRLWFAFRNWYDRRRVTKGFVKTITSS